MVMSTRAALIAGVQTWNETTFAPNGASDWGDQASKLTRYAISHAYYDNTPYNTVNRYVSQQRSRVGRYKFIRSIQNPVSRYVDLRVAKTYGGALDMETGKRGAIPIAQADDALLQALILTWKHSNWTINKSLYVRTGEICGDVFLKVIDDPAAGKVRLEVVRPENIRYIEKDAVGNLTVVVIEYMMSDSLPPVPGRDMRVSDDYTYTEVITRESFATFKDGEPFAFYADSSGNRVSRWDNPYGFVPMTHAKSKDIGKLYGAPSYYNVMSKIDELNDSVSQIADQIRKVITPVWYLAGVSKKDSTELDTTSRDELPLLYGPVGSQPFPMVAPIDIAAALSVAARIEGDIEKDLPELALHRIQESGNLTAPGIKAAYGDAIDRIVESRANYDDALVRAQMMCVSIGGYRRYEGYQAFNMDSYARGDLQHYIADRPVIEESLSIQERIAALMQSKAPDKAVWSELGIPQETIDQWESDKQAAADLAAQAPTNGQLPVVATDGTPIRGAKLPTEQATSTAHLTDQHLTSLFDQYHSAKAAAR